MKFVVEPRNAFSTVYHPDRPFGNPREDLEGYLRFAFDPDRVFNAPLDSLEVALSADLYRRSFISERPESRLSRIVVNLQPSIDVARMAGHYWRSQVWPARVAFQIVAIVGELCMTRGLHRVARFADAFATRRLVELIGESRLGAPDVPSVVPWQSSRAVMFGGLDERALAEQLATFQIFHEVGHFVGRRRAAERGESFSVDEEQDERDCDHFACGELELAYGESLGLEFAQTVPVTLFLSILIWALADHLPGLDDVTARTKAFLAVRRRASAATTVVFRLCHRIRPPSERLEMDALRYSGIFDDLLHALDRLFAEAVLSDADIFECQDSSEAAETEFQGQPEKSGALWESIWEKEAAMSRRSRR